MKKIDKIIIYSIFITPVILICGFLVWSIIFDRPTSEVIKERDLNSFFYGKIDTLYFEKQNHNIKIAELANGYKYPIFRNWERYLDVGDSLEKKKKSFKLYIYKKNKEIVILDYRDIYLKK